MTGGKENRPNMGFGISQAFKFSIPWGTLKVDQPRKRVLNGEWSGND